MTEQEIFDACLKDGVRWHYTRRCDQMAKSLQIGRYEDCPEGPDHMACSEEKVIGVYFHLDTMTYVFVTRNGEKVGVRVDDIEGLNLIRGVRIGLG